MSEPLSWANALTEKEMIDAVRKVSKPGSKAFAGERFALNIAARTPDSLADFLQSTDEETIDGIVECIEAAEKALSGRLSLVRAAIARLIVVSDAMEADNGST
jgi:hypothetical protein